MSRLYGTEKYQKVIALMNDVIAVKDTDAATSTAAWDVLFGFVHANFAAPATTIHTTMDDAKKNSNLEYEVGKAADIFKANFSELAELINSVPPELPEVVFPLAVARYLLVGRVVAVSPKSSTTFGEFNRRYEIMSREGPAYMYTSFSKDVKIPG